MKKNKLSFFKEFKSGLTKEKNLKIKLSLIKKFKNYLCNLSFFNKECKIIFINTFKLCTIF